MLKPVDLDSENVKKIHVDEGIDVYQLASKSSLKSSFEVDKHAIVFIYSPEGECGLEWPDHRKSTVLQPVRILVYSYPLKETSIKLTLNSNSTVYILSISIGRLHSFFGNSFGHDPDEIQSFVGSFRVKNIFSDKAVTPSVSVLFHQFFNHMLKGPMVGLFYQGKIMEFLSIYMQQPMVDEKVSLECSFVNDHLEMEKIKEARNLIVEDLSSPPNLRELAKLVGTNEFKLKVGFKSMFGNTVYGYLSDYRMEKARHLLEMRTHSVKEISNIIGYSNPSHFIATYKKRFGITPKKHLLSRH